MPRGDSEGEGRVGHCTLVKEEKRGDGRGGRVPATVARAQGERREERGDCLVGLRLLADDILCSDLILSVPTSDMEHYFCEATVQTERGPSIVGLAEGSPSGLLIARHLLACHYK
ncbi:hypothetical protein NQZ68_033057 [Dissostichus eleginoides]|nr:hypothetical protein NQZ68_033057 [Dissostichus eleginoides]